MKMICYSEKMGSVVHGNDDTVPTKILKDPNNLKGQGSILPAPLLQSSLPVSSVPVCNIEASSVV